MDIISEIKKCKNDEELKELASAAIKCCTEEAKKYNKHDYIGPDLDVNPRDYHLGEPNFNGETFFEVLPYWDGYIPLGTKVVYGGFYDRKLKVSSNKGYYYYVDDDSYVYEFFKYIKEKGTEVKDDFDLVWLVHGFEKKLLNKNVNPKSRYEVGKLLYQSDDLLFRPTKEHSIKDFYHNGSSMCSEISLIAENLLSIFGLNVLYLINKNHAFNVFAYDNKETQKQEIYILDYSSPVNCYDFKFNLLGTSPFIGELENEDCSVVDKMLRDGKKFTFNNYFLQDINGVLYIIRTNEERTYCSDFSSEPSKSLILKKKTDNS